MKGLDAQRKALHASARKAEVSGNQHLERTAQDGSPEAAGFPANRSSTALRTGRRSTSSGGNTAGVVSSESRGLSPRHRDFAGVSNRSTSPLASRSVRPGTTPRGTTPRGTTPRGSFGSRRSLTPRSHTEAPPAAVPTPVSIAAQSLSCAANKDTRLSWPVGTQSTQSTQPSRLRLSPVHSGSPSTDCVFAGAGGSDDRLVSPTLFFGDVDGQLGDVGIPQGAHLGLADVALISDELRPPDVAPTSDELRPYSAALDSAAGASGPVATCASVTAVSSGGSGYVCCNYNSETATSAASAACDTAAGPVATSAVSSGGMSATVIAVAAALSASLAEGTHGGRECGRDASPGKPMRRPRNSVPVRDPQRPQWNSRFALERSLDPWDQLRKQRLSQRKQQSEQVDSQRQHTGADPSLLQEDMTSYQNVAPRSFSRTACFAAEEKATTTPRLISPRHASPRRQPSPNREGFFERLAGHHTASSNARHATESSSDGRPPIGIAAQAAISSSCTAGANGRRSVSPRAVRK